MARLADPDVAGGRRVAIAHRDTAFDRQGIADQVFDCGCHGRRGLAGADHDQAAVVGQSELAAADDQPLTIS